jgi:hypothetical protein
VRSLEVSIKIAERADRLGAGTAEKLSASVGAIAAPGDVASKILFNTKPSAAVAAKRIAAIKKKTALQGSGNSDNHIVTATARAASELRYPLSGVRQINALEALQNRTLRLVAREEERIALRMLRFDVGLEGNEFIASVLHKGAEAAGKLALVVPGGSAVHDFDEDAARRRGFPDLGAEEIHAVTVGAMGLRVLPDSRQRLLDTTASAGDARTTTKRRR